MSAGLNFGVGNSIGFGSAGGTASFSRSALSNMQIGDLLVAIIHHQSGAAGGGITAPSGWVRYGPPYGVPLFDETRQTSFYYYALDSQEAVDAIPSTVMWSFTNTGGRVACIAARATGINLDDIEDSASAEWYYPGSASTAYVPGITTVSANTLLVGAALTQNSASTTSPRPTHWLTEHVSHGTEPPGPSGPANTVANLGYMELTTAGFVENREFSTDTPWTALTAGLVAFRVGPWSPPAPEGKPVWYVDDLGAPQSGELFFLDSTGEPAVPAEARPFPQGYTSVADMQSHEPFYVAHRGGGDDHRELSLQAFTQAAYWGAGALEVSLARTSDGVWFGLHDADLDRTSGTTGFVASEHTWAEVQQHLIQVGGSGPDQPYARWEEILAYYDSHVMFVDLKAAHGFREEFLDTLDDLSTPTDRLIIKFFGPSTSTVPFWTGLGYTTWGFFYESDMPSFATDHQVYDLIGMEHSASQGTWDTCLATGKPIIGHIVANPTQANNALSKGAHGLMVSGVQAVVPRA